MLPDRRPPPDDPEAEEELAGRLTYAWRELRTACDKVFACVRPMDVVALGRALARRGESGDVLSILVAAYTAAQFAALRLRGIAPRGDADKARRTAVLAELNPAFLTPHTEQMRAGGYARLSDPAAAARVAALVKPPPGYTPPDAGPRPPTAAGDRVGRTADALIYRADVAAAQLTEALREIDPAELRAAVALRMAAADVPSEVAAQALDQLVAALVPAAAIAHGVPVRVAYADAGVGYGYDVDDPRFLAAFPAWARLSREGVTEDVTLATLVRRCAASVGWTGLTDADVERVAVAAIRRLANKPE
jgi:hypothetical protein